MATYDFKISLMKNDIAKYIDQIITPIRNHFESDSHAKELLEEIQKF